MAKKNATLFAILMIATFSLSGCIAGEVIDDTARDDIENITASNIENQTKITTDITSLSTTLDGLSGDLTNLGNELTAKEASLLDTISIAEANIESLQAHNTALLITLSSMNESNSNEAGGLQLQIDGNQDEIVSLEQALAQANSDLSAVQSAISSLESTMANLQSTLIVVEQSVSDNSVEIGENNDALGLLLAQVNSLAEDLSELEANLLEAMSAFQTNPNHQLIGDLSYSETFEEDLDGDGVIDISETFRIIVLSCAEITFEDLSGMDLGGAEMMSTDFRYVDLSFSNLSDVYAEPISCDGYMADASPEEDYNATIWDKTMFLHSDLSNALAMYMYAPSVGMAFSILDGANFTDSHFSNETYLTFEFGMNGSLFDMNSAVNAIFSGADMMGASLFGNNFTSASFDGAMLTGAEIEENNFTNADFSGSDLTGAIGSGNDWSGANLSYADLTDSDLDFSDSTGVIWYFTTCPDGSNTYSGGSC